MASELAPGKRAHLALDDTESAARLLEYAFVSTVEENELFMPAVEQLYAALQEAEASVTSRHGFRRATSVEGVESGIAACAWRKPRHEPWDV